MPISRRDLLSSAGLLGLASSSSAQTRIGTARRPAEWPFSSGKQYPDPFALEVDVVFADRAGKQSVVPAFWAGDQTWRVRFAAPEEGRYSWRTVCSDTANQDLHGVRGTLDVEPYRGGNELLKRGAIGVGPDRRHFQHADGTPFFWLGDTWWMGLTSRLRYPEDFQALAADRRQKGFNVVQIVAGLYPDMPSFDPRGFNEAGSAWEPGFRSIRPAYFDMADVRIQHLVDSGIVPCIVGCWGYFLPQMGMQRMKQHWRYLVARWGALPVVWCLAGEGTMPYYLSKTPKEDTVAQRTGWTEVARYVRQVDPYHRIVTIHPSSTARNSVDDPAVLDFDMLQTGHGDRDSIPNTVEKVSESVARTPLMPVINGEVCYEGILEASRQEIQRFMFWSCVLSGAAGHTYGANGIWQVNTRETPYGPSPHGRSWGDTPWDVAAQLPGSRQLGLSRKFLMQYPWHRLEPHPEWVEPHSAKPNYMRPFAAGIPGELRIVFMPPMWNPPKVRLLESGKAYSALFFNPSDGRVHKLGEVKPSAEGEWPVPNPPTFQDWVLVLQAA
ncbi:MAG: DUF4038 domain-containing protein [Acidobacteria bacterium]|nr:DUF4038 domain-containing protein [Acidobacteriota bacterium]